MLGRETNVPLDLMVGQPPGPHRCPVEYVEWVRKAMEEAFNYVCLSLNKSAQRQKRTYDREFGRNTFRVGDWVSVM